MLEVSKNRAKRELLYNLDILKNAIERDANDIPNCLSTVVSKVVEYAIKYL